MNNPVDLKYTEDDEWIRVEGDIATIGVTHYAQDALSDIVYLELPSEGDTFEVGDVFGTIESVKAASDLITPISGEVVEVHNDLEDTPETVNESPFEEGWLIKIKMSDASQLEKLMDSAAYTAYRAE